MLEIDAYRGLLAAHGGVLRRRTIHQVAGLVVRIVALVGLDGEGTASACKACPLGIDGEDVHAVAAGGVVGLFVSGRGHCSITACDVDQWLVVGGSLALFSLRSLGDVHVNIFTVVKLCSLYGCPCTGGLLHVQSTAQPDFAVPVVCLIVAARCERQCCGCQKQIIPRHSCCCFCYGYSFFMSYSALPSSPVALPGVQSVMVADTASAVLFTVMV